MWLGLAMIFTVLTALGYRMVRRLEWAPQASFDIVGFLWLLSNLGPLLAAVGYWHSESSRLTAGFERCRSLLRFCSLGIAFIFSRPGSAELLGRSVVWAG